MLLAATTTYGRWTPPLLSEHGLAVDRLIDVLHWFMLLLFVGWGIFYLRCLISYRRRPGRPAVYQPVKAKASKYLEIAVAAFEAVLLIGFSSPVWASYKNEPPPANDRVEIHVIAQQFQWNFHYAGPDGVFGRTDPSIVDAASNPIGLDREKDPAAKDDLVTSEFHIPSGKNIYLRIASMDVIHSFFIPTCRVKQDAVPGMQIPIWFKVHEGATSEKLRQEMTERFPLASANWYRLRHHVAAEDVKHPKTGEVMLAKGAYPGMTYAEGEELFNKMRAAFSGKAEAALVMQPSDPLEVVCAQLCGNSHFKMKSKMVLHLPAEFDQWVADSVKAMGESQFDF